MSHVENQHLVKPPRAAVSAQCDVASNQTDFIFVPEEEHSKLFLSKHEVQLYKIRNERQERNTERRIPRYVQ